MEEIKLIVTDLDGTFLSHNKEDGSLEKNIQAMKAAQQAGVPVFLCTGRSWLQSESQVRPLGFDHLCIVNNGASIVDMDSGLPRYSNRLSPETVKALIDIGAKYSGHHVITQTACQSFMGFLAEDAKSKQEIVERYGPQMQNDENIRVFESVDQMYEQSKASTEMVRFIVEKENLPDAMMEEIKALPDLEIAWSWYIHLDVMAKGTNKGAALPALAEMYHVKVENIMALGDQDNDAPMLSAAGVGVAMGGASQLCKQVADYISAPVEQAGFAQAIERFVLAPRREKSMQTNA